MTQLISFLATLDPATIESGWTALMAVLLVGAGVITLLLLPWSDEQIQAVDQSFRVAVDATGQLGLRVPTTGLHPRA